MILKAFIRPNWACDWLSFYVLFDLAFRQSTNIDALISSNLHLFLHKKQIKSLPRTPKSSSNSDPHFEALNLLTHKILKLRIHQSRTLAKAKDNQNITCLIPVNATWVLDAKMPIHFRSKWILQPTLASYVQSYLHLGLHFNKDKMPIHEDEEEEIKWTFDQNIWLFF